MPDIDSFIIGTMTFHPGSGELVSDTETLMLEPKAALVLSMLGHETGSIVSREKLLDGCWGEGQGSDEALTQAIAQIRRAFESLGHASNQVETFAKRGYRLIATDGKAVTDKVPPSASIGGLNKWRLIAVTALLLALSYSMDE